LTFAVPADAYDRFMGRYSSQLSARFADLAGVQPGQRALDVGCGPGALTGELVARLGADAVAAVDPSESFVAAARERHPGVDVRQAAAENLPFPDDEFDVALAQLVVHFMTDPLAGVREMARVTALHRFDPDAEDESRFTGAREGQLVELFESAGLGEVTQAELTAGVDYRTFDEWWEPMTFGVGPAGAYVAGLDDAGREALKEHSREVLPGAPFRLDVWAWAVRAVA
jgi:SAM-dependent methyltransferase